MAKAIMLKSGESDTSLLDSIIDRTIEEVTIGSDTIRSNMFSGFSNLKKVRFLKEVTLVYGAFADCIMLADIDFNKIIFIGSYSFNNCTSLNSILKFSKNLEKIDDGAFKNCSNLIVLYFYSIPSIISETAFIDCSNITDIYVPWSEGEVANAPWGATNATIHYNTTYDENGNPQEV